LSQNLEWVDLPTKGKVLEVSENEVGGPLGFESPIFKTLIDLGGESKLMVRINAVKTDELKKGDEVKLHVYYSVEQVPVEGKNGAIIMQERVLFSLTKL
jgi:hypothetical protein